MSSAKFLGTKRGPMYITAEYFNKDRDAKLLFILLLERGN